MRSNEMEAMTGRDAVVLPKKLAFVAGAVLAAILVLSAACGGGGDDDKDTSNSTTTTTPKTTSESSTPGDQGDATVVVSTPVPGDDGTPSAAGDKATPSQAETAALFAAAQNVLTAVQARDIAQVKALSTPRLAALLSDESLNHVFDCMAPVTIGNPAFSDARGTNPSITIRLNVVATVSGGTRTAQRSWEFRLVDGQWLLDRPLPCPPKPAEVEQPDPTDEPSE